MRDSVQLDLVGETHFDFEDSSFVFVKSNLSRWHIPHHVRGLPVVVNQRVAYQDVVRVGAVVRRQWWLLFPGTIFTLMGPIWMTEYWRNWAPFAVSIVWFALCGVIPLLLFARGRTFLFVATEKNMTLLPMDRKRKPLARILGLLRQACTPKTQWDLTGTPFENFEAFDNRPATGIGFNTKRYVQITTLAGLYALGNLLSINPGIRNEARAVQFLALVIAVVLLGQLALKKRSR
jgi:hypothetical protein